MTTDGLTPDTLAAAVTGLTADATAAREATYLRAARAYVAETWAYPPAIETNDWLDETAKRIAGRDNFRAAVDSVTPPGWQSVGDLHAAYVDVLARWERAEALLYRLVGHEDGPCVLDHHDYCQAHGLHEPPCAVVEARRLLGLDGGQP